MAAGVARDDTHVVLRARRGPLLFMTGWIVMLLAVTVLPSLLNGNDRAAAFFAIIWTPWLVPVALSRRAAIVVDDTNLTVRGVLHTRTWPWWRIRGFRVGHPMHQPFAWCVMVVTDEEIVPLSLTMRTGTRAARRGAERDRDLLADWHAHAST